MSIVLDPAYLERRSGRSYPESPELLQFRSPYERDRARIIHSAPFRRLQTKTQLFNMHDHDFSRTRLTHSLEVMQIASGIVHLLRAKYDPSFQNYVGIHSHILPNSHEQADKEFRELVTAYLPPDALIETQCLAHDIGHPPYGHSGEKALNREMVEHGNFEGNAQSLRIVSKLDNYSDRWGLDFTRRTLLGIIKYPTLIDKTQIPVPPELSDNVEEFEPGKGIYLEDKDVFDWVLQIFSEEDVKKFTEIELGLDPKGHTRWNTKYKSFDCTIMELADDIAYSMHDLEDAIKFKVVTSIEWDAYYETVPAHIKETVDLLAKEHFKYDIFQRMFHQRQSERKRVFGQFINLFVSRIEVEAQNIFSSPLLDLKAVLPEKLSEVLEMFTDFARRYVLLTQKIRGTNNKGQRMVSMIFQDIKNQPTILGRKKYILYSNLATEEEKMRFICDYVSSMTNDAVDYFYDEYIA